MRDAMRGSYLLHARLSGFHRLLEQTRVAVVDGLRHAPAYVAFSGGKDSTVLLDLVLEAAPDTPVLWGDDGWDYPETLQFLADTEEHYGFKLTRIRNRGNIAGFAAWAGTETWDGANPGPWDYQCISFDDHSRLIHALGYRGVFLGLRQEESAIRRITLRQRGTLYFAQREGIWHCCPLAHWRVEDVWAYILSRELAYNLIYDRLDALGVEPRYQRVGPLIAWGADCYATLKRGWPELYNRFAAEFPQVSAFT